MRERGPPDLSVAALAGMGKGRHEMCCKRYLLRAVET